MEERADKAGARSNFARVPALVSTGEAARLAGVNPRTIRRWITRGYLPATPSPNGALISPTDLPAARGAAAQAVGGGRSVGRMAGAHTDADARANAYPSALSAVARQPRTASGDEWPLPRLPLARRPSIPLPLASLIGRGQELAQLGALLQRPDVRLVTLTGAGGTGKTRLALELVEQLWPAFADGVAFVDLAPIREPALVGATIAQTLGITETPTLPIAARLTQLLCDRELLLVLDNFEHVIDAALLVVDLLSTCPHVAVLVTSRMSLHVRGEWEYPLDPLAVPDALATLPMADLSQIDAVALFVQRAQAIMPTFALTPANATVVAAVCRRLDGLPLAIELAAARIRILSPAALLARLEHRLTVLSDGPRDLPERQQTMRAAIAWSYALLSPTEQALFRRLSVFAGGWTEELAAAVALPESDVTSDPAQAILAGLASLVDKNLVRRITPSGDEPRFDMLETLREFGMEQLRASGEEACTRERLAAAYLHWITQFQAPIAEGPRAIDFARLVAEYDNVRVALTWLRNTADAERGLRLVGALGWFWFSHAFPSDGAIWTEVVLSLPTAASRSTARAKAAYWAAWLAMYQGDAQRAVAWATESLAIYEQLGERQRLPYALYVLGHANRYLAHDTAAQAYYERAIAIERATGETPMLGRLLNSLGSLLHNQGDFTHAQALYDESLVIARAHGYTDVASSALGNMGLLAAQQGDDRQAATYYHEALRYGRDSGHLWHTIEAVEFIGELAASRGHVACAARLLSAAAAVRVRDGVPVPPIKRARYDAALTSARADLGEAAFEVTWHAGGALPLAEAIAEALDEVAPDELPPAATITLTSRERDVLRLVAQGLSDAEVAARLFLSRRTVSSHLTAIYTKLAVSSRTAAVHRARERRLL